MSVDLVVSALNVYPIKSCRGIALKEANIGARGIEFDRNWMVVTEEGRFLSQRECSRLAQIVPEISSKGELCLTAKHTAPLSIPVSDGDDRSLESRLVTVWNDQCQAVDEGKAAGDWLSEFLGLKCALVRMANDFVRKVDRAYAHLDSDHTGFADGFPFLLISEASLSDLNERLDTPLPMNRFRPNIVAAGCAAFAEDQWRKILIGDIEFDIVKPCDRCVMTTIDQDSATPGRGKEPLQTLAKFRRIENSVMFGQNLLHHGNKGKLAVGDKIRVLQSGPGLPLQHLSD